MSQPVPSEPTAARDEELAQGQADVAKLPRLLTAIVVVAIIALSIVVLSGPSLPFFGAPAAPAPTKVAVIRANLPDEPGRASAPRVGAPAPDFEWVEPGGAARRLSELRGKVVLINWWATWCGPCRAEMPALQRVARGERDLVVLAVDLQEDQDQVVMFMERLELRDLVPIIDPNGETGRRYALGALHVTYFIGADGVIRHVELGGPMDDDTIRKGIAKARGR